mmetsp:Transcript_45128/g.139023  ORF Transcript_45128/g.139023 Transcript_45128/m.139023 type:complete len:111 (-) Transcript_45128:19-351(-)
MSRDEIESVELRAAVLCTPQARASKEAKLAELAQLKAKPTARKKVPVPMADGGTSQEDLGTFWTNMRPNFGPEPSRATTKLSDDEKKALLQIAWVREEAAGMTEARAAET